MGISLPMNPSLPCFLWTGDDLCIVRWNGHCHQITLNSDSIICHKETIIASPCLISFHSTWYRNDFCRIRIGDCRFILILIWLLSITNRFLMFQIYPKSRFHLRLKFLIRLAVQDRHHFHSSRFNYIRDWSKWNRLNFSAHSFDQLFEGNFVQNNLPIILHFQPYYLIHIHDLWFMRIDAETLSFSFSSVQWIRIPRNCHFRQWHFDLAWMDESVMDHIRISRTASRRFTNSIHSIYQSNNRRIDTNDAINSRISMFLVMFTRLVSLWIGSGNDSPTQLQLYLCLCFSQFLTSNPAPTKEFLSLIVLSFYRRVL
jgi:hypothetical protein